jgi:GNAT superfamily N-acetyltransferase
MNPLKFIFRRKLSQKLEHIKDIRLEYVSNIEHFFKDYERIIAGERILDIERQAYNENFEEDKIHLESVEGKFSGSMGFIDFYELKYKPFEVDSIYMGFMGVEPQYRNKDVGTNLIQKVEQIAIERGAKRTWGYIKGYRFKEIFPFFEKLGYHVGNEMNSGDILISKKLF